jgi:hypothetical protein
MQNAKHFVLFLVFTPLSYVGIFFMGVLGSGPAQNGWQALLYAYHWKPVLLMLFANGLWVWAVYHGLKVTDAAILMAMALGVVVGFICSALYFGMELTPLRISALGGILFLISLLR